MLKFIKNKRYDTDTAPLIGSRDNGLGCDAFGFYRESLYRKKTGEYFIHTGGATSNAAENIIPMSYDDAVAWAKEYLSAEQYEAAFGGTSALCISSISAKARANLDREVSLTGKTQAQIVEKLLEGLHG